MAVTPTLAMRVQKNPVARVTDLLERLQVPWKLAYRGSWFG